MFHGFLGTLMLDYLTCQKSVSELCNKIRNMRVTLISGKGLGANFEAKKGTPGLQWRFPHLMY